ncbi:MAG: tRNA (adenosine(37)-N6)-threonylcarbamoyltransferase complex ATPase subunit type 1 TsaE [Candidatus Levybacteria bacterium RIFCSPHIGHO2_01_FULL_36_15]|nr:MAG: tRNA (adenosine(37)-N6)-threonylcarbamoyltransferase complex ATPase subunit type 1 TsaE [Candidatus Levybacteria bacterium RIFCSPHIGHO2_01_FULL_36_15]OGH38438.1 MAG: tRNA (adenosine(37)-N6)-threonylcarbamoyltransferase complex ATPase subunit type 1 TsaE [Candidatus Levybacteria bacterium RIFCSPLOWO2_01_FULL_36_10]
MKNFDQKIITNSYKETEELGKLLSQSFKAGDVVCLYGELGSGKTTFTKGVARGLGVKNRIISPTFILMRRYSLNAKDQRLTPIDSVSKIKNLYHIDLYRLESQDIKGLDLEEIMQDKSGVVLIEWPEKIKDFLPGKRWEISFKILDENLRKILIEKL